MSQVASTTSEGYSTLVFRIFLSLIFIVAGVQHVITPTSVTERLMSISFGKIFGGYIYPEPLVTISGAGLFIGGLALMLAFHTKNSALGLIYTLIPITITAQTQGINTLGPPFKNSGLLAGLIYFATNGSGPYSMDNKFNQTNILHHENTTIYTHSLYSKHLISPKSSRTIGRSK